MAEWCPATEPSVIRVTGAGHTWVKVAPLGSAGFGQIVEQSYPKKSLSTCQFCGKALNPHA